MTITELLQDERFDARVTILGGILARWIIYDNGEWHVYAYGRGGQLICQTEDEQEAVEALIEEIEK